MAKSFWLGPWRSGLRGVNWHCVAPFLPGPRFGFKKSSVAVSGVRQPVLFISRRFHQADLKCTGEVARKCEFLNKYALTVHLNNVFICSG